MSLVIAWIAAVLGLALAYIICLASGMKTVPSMSGLDVLLGAFLPTVALLLGIQAFHADYSAGHVAKAVLASGPPVAVSGFTLFIVLASFIGQPAHRGAVRRWIESFGGARRELPHRIETDTRVVTYGDSWPSQWTRRRLARDYEAIHTPGDDAVMISARVVDCAERGVDTARRVLIGSSSEDGGSCEGSVALTADRCFVALGREVICLAVPQLNLLWRSNLEPQRPRRVRVDGGAVEVSTVEDRVMRLAVATGEVQR